jgi:hypothetical protein
MRYAWLNIVLYLTNRIYVRKKELVSREGLEAAKSVLALIVLEIFLAFVSFPLYVGLQPQGVTAFLSEKSSYAKVTFDYNLRRILTLTSAGVILFIWLLKLVLILFVPVAYGPLKLYSVSEIRPSDISAIDKTVLESEVEIQSAKTVKTLAVPKLEEVKKMKGGDLLFSGIGQPNTSIILMIADQQAVMYSGVIGGDGTWKLTHTQKNFRLSDGNHLVLAYSYNKETGTRSEMSLEQYIKIKTTFFDVLLKKVDVVANWSVVIIILLGIFLTFLTI